jgi:hypothetical protein
MLYAISVRLDAPAKTKAQLRRRFLANSPRAGFTLART